MIDDYSTEGIIWKLKTGTSFNGRPEFGESVSVKGRVVFKRRIVKNNLGQEVVSEVTVYTSAKINAGDYLTIEDKDLEVIISDPKKDLDSDEMYREVLL